MSDQYFYLLDGKEHGPFSRMALESLLAGKDLQNALLRKSADQPWHSPQELGLLPTTDEKGLPGKHHSAFDELVFRNPEKTKPATSRLSGIVLGGVGLITLMGAWAWISAKSPAAPQIRVYSDATMLAREGATASQNSTETLSTEAGERSDSPGGQNVSADGCAEIVNQVIGPNPGGACSSYWQLYAIRIRSECSDMQQLAQRDPQNGSVQSLALRNVVERKYEALYSIGGEYQIKLPGHCQ